MRAFKGQAIPSVFASLESTALSADHLKRKAGKDQERAAHLTSDRAKDCVFVSAFLVEKETSAAPKSVLDLSA
jgi:hypothetical protein